MTPSRSFDRLSRQADLARLIVPGVDFEHVVYRTTTEPDSELLFVYLEGDGRPGAGGGTRPSSNPTTRRPLALELMTSAGRTSIYLARPCYNGLHDAARCTSPMWTTARYSDAVVSSLCAALERYAAGGNVRGVVLVGYSGGGTLAMLMAPRVRNLRGVITVAANLDVGAWARLHNYSPLDQSLDPAREPALDVPVVHLVGERDTNVPPAILAPYFAAHPSASVVREPAFDHRCCWVDHWPRLLDAALAELETRRSPGAIPAAP